MEERSEQPKKKTKKRDPLAVALGARVKRLRDALGLKQEALAFAAGYKVPNAIAKIESGESLPSLPQCIKLAKVLNVPLEEITGHPESPLAETRAGHTSVQMMEWIVALRRIANEMQASMEHGPSGDATMRQESC